MSNNLDIDQAQHFVGSDLGSNYLQRLSANGTSRQRVKRTKTICYFLVQSLNYGLDYYCVNKKIKISLIINLGVSLISAVSKKIEPSYINTHLSTHLSRKDFPTYQFDQLLGGIFPF